MSNNEPMENWKQFQGTELGGLMSQLYGNQNRPKINYPKPKVAPKPLPSDFRCLGSKVDAVDPRKVTRRVVNVSVPKVGGGLKSNDDYDQHSSRHVDMIPKRKNMDKIKEEMDDIVMRNNYYRPAYTQPISSDSEKDKLNQIFTFKGGKGLPEELTHPVGKAPFELEAIRKEKERVNLIREKRGFVKQKPITSTPLSENEQLAQQISHEIDERRSYLQEMKEIGID